MQEHVPQQFARRTPPRLRGTIADNLCHKGSLTGRQRSRGGIPSSALRRRARSESSIGKEQVLAHAKEPVSGAAILVPNPGVELVESDVCKVHLQKLWID